MEDLTMKRVLVVCLAFALVVCLTPGATFAKTREARVGPNIISPAPGAPWPADYAEGRIVSQAVPPGARAWIQKTQRIRENRERYIAERGFYERGMLTSSQREALAVTGTVSSPVFMVKYSNTGADPYPVSTMQTRLFDGPYSPMTLTQYYDEISYGDLNMTGTVYGWTQLANADTYYENGCNGIFCAAPIDELILETVAANDGTVDFGQYDNDGPDGAPNSGDDDGFVDFIAIVQPEQGGECINPNIWSHRYTLSGLGVQPAITNDPRNGGGFIRVNDYVIMPAYNCGSPLTIIDIGVFCHEFGHAFGMPDLYDTDGGSQGIGHWGLMGSGNWNTPPSPSHMCAWSKNLLGWMNVQQVGGVDTPYSVLNVENTNTAYRLDVTDERWRRMATCAISGSYSMRCGLLAAEGSARNWASGDGYGDGWDDSVMRQFHYNGSGSVSLQYQYSYDSELNYDYTYARIDVGGTVTTLATYTGGPVGGAAVIDLTPFLSGQGVTDYTLSFDFESDFAWSDRDGQGSGPSTCGPFVVDNIQVTGGGESYTNDFETREEGWHTDMSRSQEYFLVTNRQPVGADVNVWGNGGISIWRIQDDITRLGQDGNTGGAQYSNVRERGVMPVQADGLKNLENNVNRGDAGDAFPGSTNKTSFTNGSNPNSRSESNLATNVSVTSIPPNPANGGSMTVTMRGTWGAPSYASHNPNEGNNNEVVTVSVSGGSIAYGAEVELEYTGGPGTIQPVAVNWRGYDLVEVDFDLNGATPGLYDVVLKNPGDASVTVADGFTVNNATPTGLRSFVARREAGTVQLRWDAFDEIDILGWHVYRFVDEGEPVRLNAALLDVGTRAFEDPDPIAGERNTYQLIWLTPGGGEIAAQTSVQAGALQFALHQNYPNPFNPSTLIPFEIQNEVQTTLAIYNLRGQLVRTLVDGVLSPRTYQIGWDGKDDGGQRVSSGVYFYKLRAGSFQDVRKMVILQ